jgi:sulfur carrier protein
MDVLVNGTAQDVPEGLTVAQLLARLQVVPERVVVEVNLSILKRAQHEQALQPGDQVEIVQLIGGGAR